MPCLLTDLLLVDNMFVSLVSDQEIYLPAFQLCVSGSLWVELLILLCIFGEF